MNTPMNTGPNDSNSSSSTFWTISRRIITGFIALLLITSALGAFTLMKSDSLKKNIFDLGKNTLPSLELQVSIVDGIKDKMIFIQQLNDNLSPERRAELTKKLQAATDETAAGLKKYESLLSDERDRSLWSEATKQNENFTASIHQAVDLINKNISAAAGNGAATQEALSKYLTGTLDPVFGTAMEAAQANYDYNVLLGAAASESGDKNVSSTISLTRIFLGIAIGVSILISWIIIRSTNKALGDITLNLDHGALQTASAARQVASASQSLSSGANEQASSVEETSTSLEEMSSMIQATAENAQKAKSLASEARAVAQAGSKTMVEMTQAMAAIDSSSAEVAKIVKNIDEIAFQTNILALNAAVEAARAGEAGAGFAVVADEVRSLAQRSAAAAKETADKIEAAIVNSRKGSLSTAKVEEALTQIAEKVTSTDSLVADIATAAREQAQGIEQINSAIAQMDKVSQSNSASAEESASAAEELDAQAKGLKDQVTKLRQLVGGGTSRGKSDASQYSVSVNSSAPQRSRNKTASAVSGGPRRAAIPMPEDAPAKNGGEDEFRNF